MLELYIAQYNPYNVVKAIIHHPQNHHTWVLQTTKQSYHRASCRPSHLCGAKIQVNFDEGFNERTGKPKAVNVTGGTGPVGAAQGKRSVGKKRGAIQKQRGFHHRLSRDYP